MFRLGKIFRISLFLFFYSPLIHAITTEVKSLWWELSKIQRIPQTNWFYTYVGEMRLSKVTYPWDSIILDGGLGYIPKKDLSIMGGFYYKLDQPYHHSYGEYRLWQQIYWKMIHTNNTHSAIRTRVEEYWHSDENHNFIIFRQLLLVKSLKYHYRNFFPILYEEFFINLSPNGNIKHNFIKQNRLFFGFEIVTSKNTYWKIGYMNQYREDTIPPAHRHKYQNSVFINNINHILSIQYVFGDINILVPVNN